MDVFLKQVLTISPVIDDRLRVRFVHVEYIAVSACWYVD